MVQARRRSTFRAPHILHSLLGIRSERELLGHPKSGAAWESYLLGEILKSAEPDEAYFRGTHQGAELDLLLMKKGRRVGIEVKRADAPTLPPRCASHWRN